MALSISLYRASIELINMAIQRFSDPSQLFVTLMLLLLPLLFTSAISLAQQQHCSTPDPTTYHHFVVLVHGYMGSDREQEYLGEALLKESKKLFDGDGDDATEETAPLTPSSSSSSLSSSSSTCENDSNSHHQLIILNSKANVKVSTDGIAKGGKRLAEEISEWIEQHIAEIDQAVSPKTVFTFSLVGNSLGGLYGRYALSELDFLRKDNDGDGVKKSILPLIFCTTSSPHIGVSQETFIELPRWMEPHVATAFQQQTMNDLFGVNDSTIVRDMCRISSPETNDSNSIQDFLYPLQQFQKRIALANAYKTDFLVSVSSGAFLSRESDSIHHHQDSITASTRLMKDMGHIALQVVTAPATENTPESTNHKQTVESRDNIVDDESLITTTTPTLGDCVNSLDKLGWHKIFIDTRNILPGFMNLQTPELKPQASYTSKELKDHFDKYGTLLPIAHPLNMANSKTDLYRRITQSGQPIVDALAELLVMDMVELSERKHR